MKQAEMQSLVDTISKERQDHISKLNNLTLKEIKQIERKSYVPRRKTKEELHREAKTFVKTAWRDPGTGGDYFQQPPIMKPKLLDPWTLGRVQAPEKASAKFFFLDQKPFTYTGSHGREFKDPSDHLLSKRQKEILDEQKKKYLEWCERPSKFKPDPKEPLCFEREIRFFKNDRTNKPFGFSTHTSWETFQDTVRSKSYQRTITGRMYPTLKPETGGWSFQKLNQYGETTIAHKNDISRKGSVTTVN